ncbi:MAG: hypothetical protein IKU86_11695 [Thermoguttaceae bacterium]|nr:hypothetical protein [Thermoguttaceae bacterium]
MLECVNFCLWALTDTLSSEGCVKTTASLASLLWVLLGVSACCACVGRIMKRKTPLKYERDFFDAIVEDVAQWLAKRGAADEEQAKTELAAALNGESSELANKLHLSLRCRFIRTEPSKCDRALNAIVCQDGEFFQATFTRSIKWCFLPGAIRKEFIKTNRSEIVYDMLNKKNVESEL